MWCWLYKRLSLFRENRYQVENFPRPTRPDTKIPKSPQLEHRKKSNLKHEVFYKLQFPVKHTTSSPTSPRLFTKHIYDGLSPNRTPNRQIAKSPPRNPPNMSALEEQKPQRYRPSAALGFDPLQLPQMLADSIAAAPATSPRRGQLVLSQTVYQVTNPAPCPNMLTRAASTTAPGVMLIRSRLNCEPISGETPMYFHQGLNEWRQFPTKEMDEQDNNLGTPEGGRSPISPLRKRNMLKRIFRLVKRGGRSEKEKSVRDN